MEKLLAQKITIGDYSVEGPSNFTFADATLGHIVGSSLSYIFAFAGIGLLIMIISSGFSLMLAVGDPKKMEKGKASLTNALVGFLIIFAAFWIVQIVGVVFGWQSSISAIFGQ